ncbi:hypothetical protein C8E03_102589 [Lachnotalea glycerini]|uniref:Uncharacterized protein n=1 Tax=Lachnotalea glycerini TaxID=1763509 RepID=A0A318F0B7_9FIRM|nr:hypothetical protein [Lachnotalea glycerini]PXV93814.1 hypothetical protein C8E03_102589 [Lachnotalea glycerini]
MPEYIISPKDLRIRQIIHSKEAQNDFTIPVIKCTIDTDIDEIKLLTELREAFHEDSYNIYTVSFLTESVLYNLEYIPKELSKKRYIEKILDFVYWQTYDKQSDGILIAVPPELSEDMLIDADIEILFESEKENKKVCFNCENNQYIQIYKALTKDSVMEIYMYLKDRLAQDECEY